MICKPISNNNSDNSKVFAYGFLYWVETIYFLPFSTKSPRFIDSKMEPQQVSRGFILTCSALISILGVPAQEH